MMNPELVNLISAQSELLFDKIKGYREYLHQHPELSFQEVETMAFVSSKLKELGIEHKTHVGGTGVLGIIRGMHHDIDQECIAFRADLDALPIHEENEVLYKSLKEGVMHACGHDFHTSVLLGVAEILQGLKNELPHPVKLIFQPGEEMNPGGATLMIADGVLENPKVKHMFALHVFPDMETGKVGVREGLYMASSDEIHLTIHGVGGHGAIPQNCVNPIEIASEIVLTTKNLLDLEQPDTVPHVISFGFLDAHGATNVIPSTAQLKGTFRTMNEAWRSRAHEIMNDNFKAIALKYKGEIEVHIEKGYPYLENNPALTKQVREQFQLMLGHEKVAELALRMTAEDFAFYSHLVPVCFYRVGVADSSRSVNYGVHHPKFDIDPLSIKVAMKSLTSLAFI